MVRVPNGLPKEKREHVTDVCVNGSNTIQMIMIRGSQVNKDTSIIPHGAYCYDENGVCPYWSYDKERHEQECGYCAYLEKSDYDLNREPRWIEPDSDTPVSANELGLPFSLLWDQIKECNINDP